MSAAEGDSKLTQTFKDSRENKTNYFPREQTLSVLLYRVSQKNVPSVVG
jgi:hypothetical protein